VYLLAFDTALSGCSVCLYNIAKCESQVDVINVSRGQAEVLVPAIDKLIINSSINYEDISLIATTVGPGAFTGLRIGIACAKALGLSLQVPVIGLTTLEVLAFQYLEDRKLTSEQQLGVILETKRKDFYFQTFNGNGDELSEPMAQNISYILDVLKNKSTILIGDGLERLTNDNIEINHEFDLSYSHIKPDALARSAIKKMESLDINYLPKVRPLYLRDADVSKPKKAI
jgi:tRNA threonylcarbamoyladenosine biosynthesis protein TsaB